MIRKVIEYLRRKQNITIEDLVVEICSSNMYYKYINGTKNFSKKNLTLIKERLGADELTKEEIDEYKKDIDKVILKLMRYYSSSEEFDKDILPLVDLDTQLLLNEDLFLSYSIVRMNYLQVKNEIDDLSIFIDLLSDFKESMNNTIKLFYLKIKSFVDAYRFKSIDDEINEINETLGASFYNNNYGCFYMSQALNYVRKKQRVNALNSIETSIQLFQRDLNLIGQVKAVNFKAGMLCEVDRYDEALELLLINYDNTKKIKAEYEMFLSLSNIVCAFLGLKDIENAKKYCSIFVKRFNKLSSKKIAELIINNCIIGLVTNLEYYGLNTELNNILSIIGNINSINHSIVKKVITYNSIDIVDDKITYIESELLPSLLGKANFTYCKWLLDTCVRYYTEKRMYKKAVEFETDYLKEFKKYYFY